MPRRPPPRLPTTWSRPSPGSTDTTEFQDVYIHFGLIDADPDDNMFVDCAVAADAEYIVTNDAHFNVLKQIDWPKVSILTIGEFAAQL